VILIDTHVWIWLHSEPEKLSAEALQSLETSSGIAISTISIYETMVAVEKGRVTSHLEPETVVRRWLSSWEITRIPVSEEIVIQSRTQKFDHADPFDRLIASTALNENLPLMTADRNLLRLEWLTALPAQ